MVGLRTWFRYLALKLDYSFSVTTKKWDIGQINREQLDDHLFKNILQGKLTYLHWNKGEEMVPTIGGQGTLLIRKLPIVDRARVFVGDVVLLEDPEKKDDLLVRRLAAVEGEEMVSTDEKDEPFLLEDDECWVVSDNETLKPKDAKDSRLFGPIPINNIVGRVIYSLKTDADHGPVLNSLHGMRMDLPVLEVELDVEEMAKSTPV